MNQHELLTRLGNLKDNFLNFFAKNKTQLIKIDEKKMDHYIDPGPNVNYYSTKNSSINATE